MVILFFFLSITNQLYNEFIRDNFNGLCIIQTYANVTFIINQY